MKTWILAGMIVGASVGAALAQEDAAFRKWCLPCHDAGEGAKIKLGPPLNGLAGRPAGTFAGFNYSDAMKNSGITWNEPTFKDFIRGPMQKVPGTRMAFTGVKDDNEVNQLWDYLKQFDAEGKKK
ncbi:MAG: cytochrome c [Alphaproteobacteria bacterium]|nr:cytochrome c [Alphaproteobacteria bacterium]